MDLLVPDSIISTLSLPTAVLNITHHPEGQRVQTGFRQSPYIASSEILSGKLSELSELLGIFQYDKRTYASRADFPEAPGIISRYNECFQNQVWKSEETT